MAIALLVKFYRHLLFYRLFALHVTYIKFYLFPHGYGQFACSAELAQVKATHNRARVCQTKRGNTLRDMATMPSNNGSQLGVDVERRTSSQCTCLLLPSHLLYAWSMFLTSCLHTAQFCVSSPDSPFVRSSHHQVNVLVRCINRGSYLYDMFVFHK